MLSGASYMRILRNLGNFPIIRIGCFWKSGYLRFQITKMISAAAAAIAPNANTSGMIQERL